MFTRLSVVVLLFSCHSLSWANNDSAQQLENVNTEIQTLSDDLSKNKTSKAQLFQQLKQQSQVISDLNRELLHIKTQVEQLAIELKQLEPQQQQQQQLYDQQISALNKQIRAAYINSQPSFLKVLLNQDDPATLSRSSAYYHYFHQARQQQLANISIILQNININQQLLFAARQQLQQLYAQQQQKQDLLKIQTQQRLATVKLLEQQIADQGSRLSLLHEQQQALQALLHTLEQEKNQQKSILNFADLAGSLPWPVTGKVLARYGSPRNIGTLTWQGILIATPTGKNIVASAPGLIVFADWFRGFGQLIIINHGDQYMTLYGNNDTLLKQVGDKVVSGELIAQSGDQGLGQYTGLYFEVRHKGNPKNPLKWLDKQG